MGLITRQLFLYFFLEANHSNILKFIPQATHFNVTMGKFLGGGVRRLYYIYVTRLSVKYFAQTSVFLDDNNNNNK